MMDHEDCTWNLGTSDCVCDKAFNDGECLDFIKSL